jgi:signal transduction histidine kinase
MPNPGLADQEDREGAARPPHDPAKADILVVDDNPAKILALETALAPLGQNLIAATSGREALRQLLERNFATVILDVNMPGMDGFETAQLIRGRPRTAHTPIIFVSSINLADTDALRGYSLGAVDYILAPIIPEILRAKVQVFVQLHRKTEEARRQAAELERKTIELERSQSQLRLAERMAALGTLSAGLGHDMGNLLLPIQARLDSLDGEPLSQQVKDTVEGIRTCIAYLRRLSSGLRMLSMDTREGDSPEQPTDIDTWWPEAEPMLRNVLPPGVRLQAAIASELPRVRLARHLLTQVAFNLVQNAVDALRSRGHGTISITVERCGEDVALVVADDGPGMPREVRERCLEPFFTTKPRSLSTGLGLALIHAAVEKSGGRLEIDSAPGKGSRFVCILGAEAAPEEATSSGAVVTVSDLRQRSLLTSLLGMRGVQVLGAEQCDQASLWITDQLSAVPDSRMFLQSKPGRRLVVLGDDPLPSDAGVTVLPRNASPSQLTQAIWSR